MVCQRCRGLLVREIFDDLSAEAGIRFLATRCINCGYIEDSVVRANSLHHPSCSKTVGASPDGREGRRRVPIISP